MGWIVLVVVVLLVIGFARGTGSSQNGHRGDRDQRAENGDDQMLEDWYTSQELDNDLDDWDR